MARALVRRRWEELDGRLEERLNNLSPTPIRLLEEALICAEDRRFRDHSGIDVVGMCRAAWRSCTSKRLEGASTITQQLVRTILRDYEISVTRKTREILLAVLADAKYGKHAQIQLYMECAYFGWRMNGLREARQRLGYSEQLDRFQSAQLVARLKYPQPRLTSSQRSMQIERRAAFIQRLANSHGKGGLDGRLEVRSNRI